MSRNGIEPSGPASPTVNWMDVSNVLICWKTQPCVTFVELQKYHPHIFSRSLEGSVQCWWLCAQRPPCKYWPQLDLQVIPWQLLWFVQNINSGKGNMCCLNRTPVTLRCYWLTRWFFVAVLCPVPVWLWLLMQMPLIWMWIVILHQMRLCINTLLIWCFWFYLQILCCCSHGRWTYQLVVLKFLIALWQPLIHVHTEVLWNKIKKLSINTKVK